MSKRLPKVSKDTVIECPRCHGTGEISRNNLCCPSCKGAKEVTYGYARQLYIQGLIHEDDWPEIVRAAYERGVPA